MIVGRRGELCRSTSSTHSQPLPPITHPARAVPAEEEYQKAYTLYAATVGRSSPLFCGAAEGLAKALQKELHCV